LIIHPAIIGLTLCSLIVVVFLIYASMVGIQILRFWDPASGEEQQLTLERKTYLISTILYYVMACELFSLFLFVFIAEESHDLFIGAMCAAGTLNVNSYGYPALLARLISFVACGVWIVVNYTDSNGFDYPLIRFKQTMLLGITLLVVIETVLQFNYLLRLEPKIITSCCGTIFTDDAGNIAGEIIRLPEWGTKIIFYLLTVLTLLTGIYFVCKGERAVLFSCLSTALLVVSLGAILSFISVYYYEQPTHHCPFCLLKKEYSSIGYALYSALFIAGIAGIGVGVIHPFRTRFSIKRIVPVIQKQLCAVAVTGHTLFAVIATWPILFSDFKLV
jgi:hypothetical protein